MAGDMKTFDSARRDLLRLSSMGLAASAVSAIPAVGASKKAAAPPLSPVMFDVRTFGATGDGKTVDSPAINKAIEAAAAAGGGTVIFPAGNYMSFSIRLKSQVDLYLTQGCTIIAADSPTIWRDHGLHGRDLRCGRAAEPRHRTLPGLRPQPLAQLADLGRRHQRLLHHRTGSDLGPWAELCAGSDAAGDLRGPAATDRPAAQPRAPEPAAAGPARRHAGGGGGDAFLRRGRARGNYPIFRPSRRVWATRPSG